MYNYSINENINLFASREVVATIAGDIESARSLEATREWLSNPANRSDVNYSDIYKDVYGYRPRW